MQVTLIVTEEAKHSLTQRYNQVTAQPLNRRVSLQSDDPTKSRCTFTYLISLFPSF